MDAEIMSPAELELRADSLRGEIGSTLDRLRVRLRPRNIADEVAERSGVRDLTPSVVFNFAAKEHPVATALVGLGLGLWAFSMLRSSGKPGPGAMRQTISTLSQSTQRTFSERAKVKREEFIRAAEEHLTAGAIQLSDAVEKGVGQLISQAPVPPEAKPLMSSAAQIILIAAMETIVGRIWRSASGSMS